MPSPQDNSAADPLLALSRYTLWPEIFRSWFWRTYDHLFRLVLYNFGWALTCCCVGWMAVHAGLVDPAKPIHIAGLFRFYALYVLESLFSVGWAYAVFRLFIEGNGVWKDLWTGTRKYFLKALGVSSLSGLFTGLTFYNLYFYFSILNSQRFLALLLTAFTLWILIFWLACCMYQWPLLFFQNPPFFKIFYRSFLLTLGNGLVSVGIVLFLAACLGFFLLAPFLFFFIGAVFLFSFQCVVLEKNLLRYKITYGDKPLGPFLEYLETERQRDWREFLRPWGNR